MALNNKLCLSTDNGGGALVLFFHRKHEWGYLLERGNLSEKKSKLGRGLKRHDVWLLKTLLCIQSAPDKNGYQG